MIYSCGRVEVGSKWGAVYIRYCTGVIAGCWCRLQLLSVSERSQCTIWVSECVKRLELDTPRSRICGRTSRGRLVLLPRPPPSGSADRCFSCRGVRPRPAPPIFNATRCAARCVTPVACTVLTVSSPCASVLSLALRGALADTLTSTICHPPWACECRPRPSPTLSSRCALLNLRHAARRRAS